jgi:hypothetical protein
MHNTALLMCLTHAIPPHAVVFAPNKSLVNNHATFFEFFCRTQGETVVSPCTQPPQLSLCRWQSGNLDTAIVLAVNGQKPLVVYEYPWLLLSAFAQAIRLARGKEVHLYPAPALVDYTRNSAPASTHTKTDLDMIVQHLHVHA